MVNKTVLSAVLNGSLCTLASPCWINLSRQDVLVLLASPETLFTKQFNYSPVLTDVFCLHLWGFFFFFLKVFQDIVRPNVKCYSLLSLLRCFKLTLNY